MVKPVDQFRRAVQHMASTAEALAEITKAAPERARDGAGGEAGVGVVPILGTTALLCYRLDKEAGRRRRAGLGAVTSPDVLGLLLGLPVGVGVPLSSLTAEERSVLPAAPSGAVTVDGGLVIRQAVRPLTVDAALVAAGGWRRGLQLAGRFAPFCSRVMVLNRLPCGRGLDDLRVQADFYGIGVAVINGDQIQVVVAPGRFCRQRISVAGWQFAEQVYQHL
jgi:hypothetical protein